MNDNLKELENIWTTNRDEYLLIEYVDAMNGVTNYAIFHLPTKTVLLMEDDSVSELVLEEMLKAGVPITKSPPR